MKGLREIVLVGALCLASCDVRKDIDVETKNIGDLKLKVVYECIPLGYDNYRFEIYDSNNALRFKETISNISLEEQGVQVQFNGEESLTKWRYQHTYECK